MKYFTLFFFAMFSVQAYGQSLPISFEGDVMTSDFVDFDGGVATVIPNPQIIGDNTSSTVAQIIRNGGQVWAGSKIKLDNNLDLSTNNIISMQVFTTAPVGTTVKFKLEGIGAAERDTKTTVSGAWETLSWDFTGTPNDFDDIVFMFDFGNVGNGTSNSTFLFDNVQLLYGGKQIDLPVTFEDTETNYTLTDFEGGYSELAVDPTDATNNVAKIIKGLGAGTSAGTTIGTPAGFATNIPLTLTNSKMNVKVWSPDAGIPVRLKVEDWRDPTHTCETQTNTTKSGEWEIIEFDFINQAMGTELLSVGLDKGWTYNMASIFFNFGTEGSAAGEKIYYFDNVKFGASTTNTIDLNDIGGRVFPNPTISNWIVDLNNTEIQSISIFNMNGQLVSTKVVNLTKTIVNGAGLLSGFYFLKISTSEGLIIEKLYKQ